MSTNDLSANMQQLQCSAPPKFTLFQNLPTELRLKIWRLCLHSPDVSFRCKSAPRPGCFQCLPRITSRNSREVLRGDHPTWVYKSNSSPHGLYQLLWHGLFPLCGRTHADVKSLSSRHDQSLCHCPRRRLRR